MSPKTPLTVAIEAVDDVQAATQGDSIIVKAQAHHGDARSPLEIAITTELAAAVAFSLLATTARARRSRDTMEPALECFAAGVEDSSQHHDRVRLQLLFDGGTVLPVEMRRDAGEALMRELADWLDGRRPQFRREKEEKASDANDGA
ncbi:MAG TPA: hypothetical protein VNU71_08370 [Burkholderiaceae bacterium]|nr:hypothetical protein [Burkholderiaceae bacterium]